MVHVGQALMRSVARGLTLQEPFFDHAFKRGLSTLRLPRYPVRTDAEQTAETVPDLWITYGDYLWATTTQFAEFKGMESLRS
jgi:isopenicillin N synthase-like dioxygenase